MALPCSKRLRLTLENGGPVVQSDAGVGIGIGMGWGGVGWGGGEWGGGGEEQTIKRHKKGSQFHETFRFLKIFHFQQKNKMEVIFQNVFSPKAPSTRSPWL